MKRRQESPWAFATTELKRSPLASLNLIRFFSAFVIFVMTSNEAKDLSGQEASNVIATPFGHKLLREEFLLNYTNLNHGSYGACPRSVLECQSLLRIQQEQQPDPWMRSKYLELLKGVREEVARYVNADDPENLVLVESASTAVNSILRSSAWMPGDVILYFSVAYGMVKNTARWLSNHAGVEIVEVPVEFPISDGAESESFATPLECSLRQLQEQNKSNRLKYAILDHIASLPAVRLPIRELAIMIKEFSPHAFVLVDGAHSLGHLPNLDVQQLGPIDAYLSNGHKWLYSPKGSAFLWVNASWSSSVFPEPTVISSQNGPETTSLADRFSYTGTRDYTSMLSMSAALEFRQRLEGDSGIYAYVRNLALSARRYLLNLWNVTALTPESMEDFMFNICLPTNDFKVALDLQKHLLNDHGIYIVVAKEPTSGMVFTRLSAQVYLEMSDFVRLGNAVLQYESQTFQQHSS